ncbi:MAG: sensor histidine kinase, partial [Balneolaceae bacterium]
ELHHRVKNNLALISALFELQASFTNNDAVNKILQDSRRRIKALALAHDFFSEEKAKVELDFKNYLSNLIDFIYQKQKKNDVPVELVKEIDDTRMSINQAIPCGLICNELLSNAFQYAFTRNSDSRIVRIIFKKEGNSGVLKISDNGKGLQNKTMYENPESFGFTIVKTLADQLKADVDIKHNNGTEFEIRFDLTYTKGSGSAMLHESA